MTYYQKNKEPDCVPAGIQGVVDMAMETRGITFRRLREMCPYKYYWGLELRTACEHDDVYEENTTVDCCKKDCPVWAKLRRGDEVR